MPRPRCGAPLLPTSDTRRKHATCRHIVQEGNRCHRHRDIDQLEIEGWRPDPHYDNGGSPA